MKPEQHIDLCQCLLYQTLVRLDKCDNKLFLFKELITTHHIDNCFNNNFIRDFIKNNNEITSKFLEIQHLSQTERDIIWNQMEFNHHQIRNAILSELSLSNKLYYYSIPFKNVKCGKY